MKYNFVLDENIIILAQKGEDPHGHPDMTCLELITAMERKCHTLVLGPSFWEKYSRQIRTLQRQRIPLVPNLLAIVKSMLVNREKEQVMLSDFDLTVIDGLEQLQGIDAGDREFVRAAASVNGAILVTTDSPLMERLRQQGIDQMYGFTVLSPQEALTMAGAVASD